MAQHRSESVAAPEERGGAVRQIGIGQGSANLQVRHPAGRADQHQVQQQAHPVQNPVEH